MKKKCKHENTAHMMPGDFIGRAEAYFGPYTAQCEQRRCLDCGAWLSLWKANDVGTCGDLAVEIRAAELSDLAASHADHMESSGWTAHLVDGEPLNDWRWHAGWLGRQIRCHAENCEANMFKAPKPYPVCPSCLELLRASGECGCINDAPADAADMAEVEANTAGLLAAIERTSAESRPGWDFHEHDRDTALTEQIEADAAAEPDASMAGQLVSKQGEG